MKKRKILTIIIPAYNMENYLKKCCDSLIIEKNLEYLEVLIINDGSKDLTSFIAHEFEGRYSSVFRVIDKENGNYGSCINLGLMEANGEFIKILDADDSFDKNNFALYIQYLLEIYKNKSGEIDLIITDRLDVDADGKMIVRNSFTFPKNRICGSEELLHNKVYNLSHHSVTYRTEMIRNMNYVQTEGISYTDHEWACLPLLAINKFIYYPQCIYVYLLGRVGQTMESDTYIKNMWMRIAIVKNILCFYTKNKNQYTIVNQRCLEVFLCFTIERIYVQYLITDKQLLNVKDIEEFDQYLRDNYYDFYKKTSDINTTGYYRVKFICYWRKPQCRWKYYAIYYIYRFLTVLKKVIH